MPPKRNAECATVAKPKAISKSTARKPLRDVSNAGKVSSKSAAKKLPFKIGEEDDHPPQAASDSNTAVDRLILIHSDISSFFRQIDELVVEALKFTSKKGMNEIESFADFLSQMQTSLKPWVPRFQRVLSVEPVNQLGNPVVCREDESRTEAIIHVVERHEQTKWDSLVSPSPLVAWRGGCTAEGGRQLFLLTPLSRQKALSVKYREPSKSALDASTLPLGLDVVGETNDDLLEGVVVKHTPIKVFDRTLESKCVSPPNLFRRDGCLLVMTPCLKVSPPKSCVILEPLAEVPRKNSLAVHRSTPFPKGILESDNSQDSESSTFHGSERM